MYGSSNELNALTVTSKFRPRHTDEWRESSSTVTIVTGKRWKSEPISSNLMYPTNHSYGEAEYSWGVLSKSGQSNYRSDNCLLPGPPDPFGNIPCYQWETKYFDSSITEERYAPPNIWSPYLTHYGSWDATTSPSISPIVNVPYDVATSAQNKLLDKINQGKVSLGVELAESRATYKYIADKFIFLTKVLKAVKSGNKKKLQKMLRISIDPGSSWYKSLASRFLEVNYAITPIVLGINDAIAYVEGKRELNFSVKQGFSAEFGFTSVYRNDSTTRKDRINGHYKYVCAFTHNPTTGLSKELGIHPSDLSSIVWELVPFSFVVDHGLKIGDWLSRAGATTGLSLVSAYRSASIQLTGTKSTSVSMPRYGVLFNYRSQGESSYKFSGYQRIVLTAWPANTLETPVMNFVKARNLTIYLSLLISIRG